MDLLIYLLAIAASPIVIPQVSTVKITGPESIIAPHAHPWLVSVQKNDWHVCAGSILSETLILTATACTEAQSLSELKVRAGSSSIFSGGSVHNVIAATRYRNDSMSHKTFVDNLALLKVSPILKIGKDIREIQLANGEEIFASSTSLYIIGWDLMSIVHKIGLQMVDKCTGQVLNEVICATPLDGEKRFSDIGSPLILNGYLVGVVAIDPESNLSRRVQVYTKVSAYRGWLDRSIIALNDSKPM